MLTQRKQIHPATVQAVFWDDSGQRLDPTKRLTIGQVARSLHIGVEEFLALGIPVGADGLFGLTEVQLWMRYARHSKSSSARGSMWLR